MTHSLSVHSLYIYRPENRRVKAAVLKSKQASIETSSALVKLLGDLSYSPSSVGMHESHLRRSRDEYAGSIRGASILYALFPMQ